MERASCRPTLELVRRRRRRNEPPPALNLYGSGRGAPVPWMEAARESRRSPIRQEPDTTGRRILVVEDELLIALEIDTILSDAGFEVIGPASSNAEALRLIEQEVFDGAFLDANLGGRTVDDIAARLAAHAIPFVFVTGYGRENLPSAFRGAPLINKPFADRQLLQAAFRFAEAPSA